MKLLPPKGCKIVTKGTTNSGDRVWNERARKWEPVDSVNEYVSEYIAVARPAGLSVQRPEKPKAEPASTPKQSETERALILKINATPALLSALYDANLLPEQTMDGKDWPRTLYIAAHWPDETETAQQRDELAERLSAELAQHQLWGDNASRLESRANELEKQRDELAAELERIKRALPGIVAALARGARFASDEDCQPEKGSQ